MQLNEQLLITYECVSAIGTSLRLQEMIEHFLKVFSRKTGALASVYWEYSKVENDYTQLCLYGKKSFQNILKKPSSLSLSQHCNIREDVQSGKQLLHVKIGEDWMIFVFQANLEDLEFIISIIYSFSDKLENAVYACKNHLELMEINQNLEKRVEEELYNNRAKDKHILQQSRLAQMGEMISMIAHQWRQPLGSISAVATSLKLKTALNKFDLTQPEGREANKIFIYESMEKIENYVNFLTHTIDDFRNFFKPDKQQELSTTTLLIERTLEIIGKALEINGISICVEKRATKEILTYTNEVTQVILNILKNAEDILKERKVAHSCITIRTKENIGVQIIEIEDNGGGINDEILPHIFEPYFSTKDEKNGSGLGLYMSKTIIEEHCNGKISATNGAYGAKFIIELKES